MSLGNISQCPASAFRAADLLFWAAPTEIRVALFLFRYFSVMSPQQLFFPGLSWAEMPLLAQVLWSQDFCRQHGNSSPYGKMQSATGE